MAEERQLAVWCGDCGQWRREEKCPECGFNLRAWFTDAELDDANAHACGSMVYHPAVEAAEVKREARELGPAPLENDLEYQKRIQRKIVTGE